MGRRVGLLIVAALLIGGSVAAAQSGQAVSHPTVGRQAAIKAALAALGARSHTVAEIVFALPSPVAAGTVVREAGPAQPGGAGQAVSSPASKVATAKGSSWLFYEDLAPFTQYEHAGRIALVNAASGRVTVSRTLSWPPSIGNQLLVFLRTQANYEGTTYRVFYRPYTGAATLGSGNLAGDLNRRDAGINQTLGARVASVLANQHACAFTAADTLPYYFYSYARLDDSRRAINRRLSELSGLDHGFKAFTFQRGSKQTLTNLVAQNIQSAGCRDVMLYLAGGGYPGGNAINLGMQPGTDVLHQDVTLAELRSLISSHPAVRFEILIDAPESSAFKSLVSIHNVMLVATPSNRAFTYLPEAKVGGQLVRNSRNPQRISQFTKRLGFGLSDAIDNSCEVGELETLVRSGQVPSAQAYLMLRAIARGGPVDFAMRAGLAGAPTISTNFSARRSPGCLPATVQATPDSYSTTNATALTVPTGQGVLSNDTDSAGFPLAVNQLNGHGGASPLTGTSAKGATVTMNGDGSFTYDPTGSPTLQALAVGQVANDTFTYQVIDHNGGAATGTATIRVTGTVHHPPVLSGIESSTVGYAAGSPAVPVTSTLAVADPDSSTLVGATVSITSGFVSAEDSLNFINQNGITGSYNAATGVLTLTGTASLANYQAALRSVTFSDSNGSNPTTGARTVSFQVNDGNATNNLSNTETRDVQVSPNTPPTANNDSASTDKKTAIDISVLANDSDPDGDTVSVASINTAGTLGNVSINPDGTIHYDPNGQFNGLQAGQTATDTFTYQATDGFHNSTPATVTVTINGVNDPPVLSNIETTAIQYDAGTPPVQMTGALTIANPHGTTLSGATVSITSGLAASEDALGFTSQNGITGTYDSSTGVLTLSGTASVADYQTALRSVTYSDPNGTAPTTGARTISFQVDDGAALNNLSNTVSRDVTVNPNPPPTAVDDAASTDKHTAIDIPVLANDFDTDGDTLGVASVDTTGTKGLVSINPNGTIHYDPNGAFTTLQEGQTATDTFTYQATDGFHNSTPATVTVTITGSNDAPVLAGIESSPVSYNAGTPGLPVTSALTVSDDDDTNLQGATVSISSGLASGEDSLNFTNQNGITGSYNSATGVLTLTGSATLANYQSALRSVTYSDSNGVSPTTGTRTVTFQVDDGHASNNLSNTVSRDITVNPNPPPTAVNDSASTDKNTAIDINVLANDFDSDGDTVTVDPLSLNTTGTKGLVSLNANGTIHYDPTGAFTTLQAGQTATDTFTYEATDGFHNSSPATVTVTINGSNDPPVLSNIETTALTYFAGTPAVPVTSAMTVSDDDDTNLQGATASISSGFVSGEDVLGFTSQNGITGSYNGTTGVLTLTGSATVADYQTALQSVTYSDSNGASATTGTRTISFQADDGHAQNNLSNVESRDITVSPNAPPVAGDVSASTDKHTAIDINVLASVSDPDGDPVTVASVDTTGTKGTVSINPDGTIHYDPNGQFQGLTAGQTATDTFTYRASDGFQDSSPATVTVTINGVNDPPVLSNIETSAVSYRAQDPAVQITSSLAISDDDDSTISGATASITSGFSSANDTLQFTNQNGITGSYNAATGVLTLSGNASIADYQTALHSIEFFTADGSVSPANRTVSFTVTDSVGATSTTPASRTIDVAEANQPPTANNVSYNAVGNTTLGVGTSPSGPAVTVNDNLLNHASDPDSGGPVTLTGHTSPAHGTLTLNSDGTFTYVPNAGFSGTDTFTYTVTDSDDPLNPKSATATVTITVGTVVWYVDDSLTSAGTGQSNTPFNTLAAANGAAGANSIIFLYQGNATYTGGVSMKSGEDLFGQPHGLTVSGHSLVAAGGSNPTITNSGGDGIDLGEGSDVEAVSVSNPSGNGVAASSINSATVGGTNAVSISGAGGDGIHISGGNGNLNFANTSVTGSTGHSLSLASHTGGINTFGGNLSDSGTGISLTGNTGGTINLSGTITASTGTHPAFTATGGGTVTATGSGSTLTTTTGTALNVQNTTIGASGLKFQSISSNGANPGIALSSTGSSGGLTVTGTGSAGSGGTIQGSAGNGMTLSSTSSPSFTDMVIKNNAADGINGTQVSGLTLASSTVSGNGTQANVSGENDDGLDFSPNGTGSPNGLTGTVTISNSTITTSADNNAIISDSSGTLNLTITGSTFSSNNATTGNDGIHIDADGSTNATVSVTGSTFTNNFGDHFQFSTDSASTGTNSVTFSNNTLTTTVSGVLGGGVVISPFGNSHTTLTANSNNIQNSVFTGIAIDEDGTSGTLSGTVNGNTIGTAATTNSGSQGNDIGVFAEGSVTETLAITNNNLFQYDNEAGISFLDREGNPTMNLTITGNTIADPGTFGSWGLLGEAGATSGDNGTVCAAISGNSMKGSAQAGQGGADFELDQEFNSTIRLPGYAGGSQDTNAVVTFIQGNNTGNGTPSGIATTSGTGGGFTGGATCPGP